jgi:5-methylthioadenosine/S-adenosylhomocysteine deaminase
VTEVSADWVLPIDGPPVAGGLVRYEDNEIVEVTRGRAERHFTDAAIVPGFVNAHSHLEYAVYAGFGDGQAFGPWIKTHVERKSRLDHDAMIAIARCGVLESLRAGITTTADYSFAGAAAAACSQLGLRAIVYLEVFADDPADAQRQFEEKRALVEETELVHIGISPHAPYTCSLDTYRWCLSLGIPVGTHLAESANENEWLEHGTGPLEGIPILVKPTGKRAVATLEPVLGPELLCAHCVEVDDAEIALLAERDVPVAHCPRSNASASASARIRLPRRPRSTCSRRCARPSTRRGRAPSARRRSSPRTRCGSQPSTRRARCESTRRWVP